MVQFYVFILICFVNCACGENPTLSLKIVQELSNKVIPFENELIITSKEDTVQIIVGGNLPDQSINVTIDQLVCYDKKTIVFRNSNFTLEAIEPYHFSRFRFKSTQDLKTLRGIGAWQWICKLSTHWRGINEVYPFHVKVKMPKKNETNESTFKDNDEKITLHENQGAKNKPMNKSTGDSNDDAVAKKNNHEPTGKSFSNKKPEKQENQPTEPKSLSIGNTEQISKDQKFKNQKDKEKNDGIERGIKPNVNDSSNQVAYGDISTSTSWILVVVVPVIIFIVGLVIGTICRRPAPASTPVLEPQEQTDDLTNQHIYEEVAANCINNRPPLTVPDKEYIYNNPYDHTLWFHNQHYNTPYDHTPWFQNEMALK